jgi:NAD(P)-dependent dehydrogenase (short-subunit alcohol dehydrogenase family)
MNPPEVKALLDLSGRVAIVTGAGAGMGTGIARRFAEAGASIAVHYLKSADGALRLADAVEAIGGRAVAVQADLTAAADVERLMTTVREALGAVDVLVNNAGVYPVSELTEMSEAEWDLVVDANLKSVHLATQAAARLMRAARHGGAIVNIASIEAGNVAPGHAHYAAAKAGVVMYTRAAARELGPFGIRVNAVSPGLIWRERLDEDWPDGVRRYQRAVPLGRLGDSADVADACLFLASTAARWITGAELVVDGGVLTATAY